MKKRCICMFVLCLISMSPWSIESSYLSNNEIEEELAPSPGIITFREATNVKNYTIRQFALTYAYKGYFDQEEWQDIIYDYLPPFRFIAHLDTMDDSIPPIAHSRYGTEGIVGWTEDRVYDTSNHDESTTPEEMDQVIQELVRN